MQPQLEKLRGDRVETYTHVENSSRGKLQARWAEDHMQPYLQVRGGVI